MLWGHAGAGAMAGQGEGSAAPAGQGSEAPGTDTTPWGPPGEGRDSVI